MSQSWGQYLQQYGPSQWGNSMRRGMNNFSQGMSHVGTGMRGVYDNYGSSLRILGTGILLIGMLVAIILVLKYYWDSIRGLFDFRSDEKKIEDELSVIIPSFDFSIMEFNNDAIRNRSIELVRAILLDNEILKDNTSLLGTSNSKNDPKDMLDISLYTILLEYRNSKAIKDTIDYKIPKLHKDINYIKTMTNYDQDNKKFQERNTAITILGNYYSAKSISKSLQSMSDEQIYKEMFGSDMKKILFGDDS